MDNGLNHLIKEIKEDEGYREYVYTDSEGFPTCGYGHHLYPGSKINEVIANEFLRTDITGAINDFWTLPVEYRRGLEGEARKRVIINMIFNMGLSKVLKFKKMWRAVQAKDFPSAAKEMLDSKWARQVGNRAVRLARMMEEGD